MPIIVGSSTIVSGTAYTLGVNDSIYVPRLNTVGSTSGAAISGGGSTHEAVIAGDVFAASYGVNLGTSSVDFGNSVRVLAGATVAASLGAAGVAVRIQGRDSLIVNEGSISGGFGIVMGGNGTGSSMLTNTGTISGDYRAIGRFFATTEKVVVTNYGSILATTEAGICYNSTNAGMNAVDVILNHGWMSGDVVFGDGEDLFDNRDGFMDGTVFGQEGDDTFIGNQTAAEVFDGGLGVDTLDFRNGAAVQVALDLSFENQGAALGDSYAGFEKVLGSVQADVIRGNAETNQLVGMAGADALDGAEGADVLRGGAGADTLTGGLGNDVFRFINRAECGDVITDFRNVAGDNDKFQIDATGFGGGLVAGVLAANRFQSRADNLAQDADDRFIFRTTDRTLWFDADGIGAGAALLVADLQAGATVTASDIQLI